MSEISITAARKGLADLFEAVVRNHERIIIHRYGKDRVALVPVEDAEFLEALEDRMDIEEAARRLADGSKPIPYDQVRKELGLT